MDGNDLITDVTDLSLQILSGTEQGTSVGQSHPSWCPSTPRKNGILSRIQSYQELQAIFGLEVIDKIKGKTLNGTTNHLLIGQIGKHQIQMESVAKMCTCGSNMGTNGLMHHVQVVIHFHLCVRCN